MNKSIGMKFRTNIIVLSIIVTMVFLMINVALYLINNNYLINKVKQENEAFLLLTTHLINENEIGVALEYVEHYTHIHEVEIEVVDESGTMLYSSSVAHRYVDRYTIDTDQGTFTVFIDNSGSVTVTAAERTTIYVNVSLLVIYLLALAVLLRKNRSDLGQIHDDIEHVLSLIDTQSNQRHEFHHEEFRHIHEVVTAYLENIDFLTDQKDTNVKGLAHDIKTPLTIVYSYYERVLKQDLPSVEETIAAHNAAMRINELLSDIVEDNQRTVQKEMNLSRMLHEKLEQYRSILATKQISVHADIQADVLIRWRERSVSRVIENLVGNAYYYSLPGTTLEVTLKQDERVVIQFTSTPMDVADVDVDRMFQKGHRGTTSESANPNGKGYGLYLCRLLLNQDGGTIGAELTENKNVKITIVL